MENGTQRDIGHLEGQMESMQKTVDKIETQQKEITKCLHEINSYIDKQKGEKRVIGIIATGFGAVGATIANYFIKH